MLCTSFEFQTSSWDIFIFFEMAPDGLICGKPRIVTNSAIKLQKMQMMKRRPGPIVKLDQSW